MSKIYFVSELFYPNRTSTAYIMTEIAKHFDNKADISVICSSAAYDNNYSEKEDPEAAKLELIVCDLPEINKNKLISRSFGAIRSTFTFGWKICKHVKRGDTVFAVTNPFLIVLVIGLLKRIIGFRYVLLVHDVFPENGVPAGVFSKHSIIYKTIKSTFDWSYKQADKLIALGRDMADLLSLKTKNSNKIHVVENWYDTDLIYNFKVDRNKYLGGDYQDKIIIGFAGNLGRVQRVLDFVKILSQTDNDKLLFVIVGDGAERKDVFSFINEHKVKNVLYLGPKKREEQSLFLNCFDIGLITLAPGMYGLGVPSKSYNLLYLGKPILYIGDPNSEIDLVINQYNVGKSFTWGEETKIIAHLNSIKSIDYEVALISHTIAEREFSSDIILSKLNSII